MGGEFDSRDYEGKHTKAEILRLFHADVEIALYDNGHRGYTGTIAEKGHKEVTIKWIDKVVATPERAEELINKQSDKWEEAMGVFYKSVEGEGCVVGAWCSS